MTKHHAPRKNHLLAALPDAGLQRWLPLLQWIDLPLRHVVGESGVRLSHVYFPTSAIISLLACYPVVAPCGALDTNVSFAASSVDE